jgi:hypothetical protein
MLIGEADGDGSTLRAEGDDRDLAGPRHRSRLYYRWNPPRDPRLQPRRRQAPRIMAKIAGGERVGALGGGPVDRHPAAIFTPWARPESCRFLRLDLLHAIMNRFPVVGDWFRHLSVPLGFAAFFQRRGYQLRTRLPRLGGRIDTPELNGFRYAGRLRSRPRAIQGRIPTGASIHPGCACLSFWTRALPV